MPHEVQMPFSKTLRTKTCAAQLFGSWMVEPGWFSQAIEAVRSGKLKPAQATDDDDDAEEKRPALTVANIDEDYGPDEKKGYKLITAGPLAGIAIICIEGTMLKYRSSFGGCSTVETRRAIRAAVNDRMVSKIMLYIDSPGGSVAGTSDLGNDVRAAAKKKPLYAFFANMGASAAYWVGSQANKIYANEVAMVGSIGVFCVLADDTKWQEEIGVKWTVVSTGPYKGLGADGKVSDQLISDVQRENDELNERFLAAIADGRGMPIDKVRALADGRVHVGEKAVQQGLVDVVGTFDAALQALSLEKPKMITREQFDAYAAEHPDAVQRFVEKGKTDAAKALATVSELEAVMPGDPAFVMTQLKAGASVQAAAVAGCAALRQQVSELKTSHATEVKGLNDKHEAAIKDKDQKISQLEFEAKGQGAIRAGGKTTEAPANEAEFAKIADPKERAKAEWKANFDDCQQSFISEAAYVGFRAADLRGGVTVMKSKAD